MKFCVNKSDFFSLPVNGAQAVSSTDDLDDFWSDSILVMILFFWMIVITVVVIIFAMCWCFTLYTRRKERHAAEREQYYREQTLLDYNSKPEISVNVSKLPLETPSLPSPPPMSASHDVRSGSITEPPPPEWLNSMKQDDYADFQFDTITRSGKPAGPVTNQHEYETRSLPRSTPIINTHNGGGHFAYDNVVAVTDGAVMHHSQPNLMYD